MRLKSLFNSLILCVLCLAISKAKAQRTETLRSHLGLLQTKYLSHQLTDTAYLKAVDSIAPLLVKDDSLKEELTTYREIAFDKKELGAYRGRYYVYLTLSAYNRNEFGSAIYYAEKTNEEKTKAGLFEKGGIPHSEMVAITVYYNNKDYNRVFTKYATLRPALVKLSLDIPKDSVSADQAYLAFAIINSVVYASFNKKDTSRVGDCIGLCEKMLSGISKFPDKYKVDTTVYQYIYHCLLYSREKYLGHYDQACRLLETAIAEVRSGTFQPNWQPAYTEELYGEAVEFFQDNDKRDSVARYLGLIHHSNDSLVEYSSMNQRFFLEHDGWLQAVSGNYKSAYKDLLAVYKMSDSAFYAVSADKDNNLYALAEAENARTLLLGTESRQRKAERFNILLFSLLGVLIFAGTIGFLIYRADQKQRLLNLQLGLARNFHDEIGPMLLYANTLATREAQANPGSRMDELKNQIGNIMEAVRGISHDLKSNQLSTVDSLYKDISVLAEKLKATTQINFDLSISEGQGVLSHFQFTNLRKVVTELITNSVKHAACSQITIAMDITDHRLRVRYADNGKGIPPPQLQRMDGASIREGIGFQNMKERINMLNGSFQLHNSWPDGYFIDISIPLL